MVHVIMLGLETLMIHESNCLLHICKWIMCFSSVIWEVDGSFCFIYSTTFLQPPIWFFKMGSYLPIPYNGWCINQETDSGASWSFRGGSFGGKNPFLRLILNSMVDYVVFFYYHFHAVYTLEVKIWQKKVKLRKFKTRDGLICAI